MAGWKEKEIASEYGPRRLNQATGLFRIAVGIGLAILLLWSSVQGVELSEPRSDLGKGLDLTQWEVGHESSRKLYQ